MTTLTSAAGTATIGSHDKFQGGAYPMRDLLWSGADSLMQRHDTALPTTARRTTPRQTTARQTTARQTTARLGAMLLSVALLAGSSLTARCSVADELPKIPTTRVMANNLTIFRLNPIGLENRTRFGWQRKLYEGHARATNDNFIFAGTYLRVHPAGGRVAALLEVQPVALFNLRLTAEALGYLGNFTFIQSRASAFDDLSDKAMAANKEGPQGNYRSGGLHFTIEPTLQAAVGPIVVRTKAFFGRFDMSLQRGDAVWYEPTLDVPVSGNGWVFANDLDVLYRKSMGEAMLTLGLRYSVVRPLYGKADVLEGQDVDAAIKANDHHRVGVLAAYTLYDRPGTSFNKPSIVGIVSRYVDHRFRTGSGPNHVNANVPYFVLGFAFESDLLGK